MVLEDCIECHHGETIKISGEYYSKCHHENCLSIHAKCISRRALLKYFDLKQILSIHILKREYHESRHHRYPQDSARKRMGAEDSDSARIPSDKETI